MKITITKEFETVEEAYAFLERMADKQVVFSQVNDPTSWTPTVVLDGRAGVPLPGMQPPMPDPVNTKKPRKPRSDAGRVRGPYKTAGGAPDGTPPNEIPSTAAPTSAAPASPPAPASEPSAGPAGLTLAAAEVDKELTIDDARAALKRINDTKGLGTPVCIGHLQAFGVNRISDLPANMYEDFIFRADEMIAKRTAK